MSNAKAQAAVPFNSKDRRALRARAHALRPVVWISEAGATPSVLREIDRALSAHELIKIHAGLDGRAARESLIALVCLELAAEPVQIIGKMLIVYRKRAEQDKHSAPATPVSRSKPRKRAAHPRHKPRSVA